MVNYSYYSAFDPFSTYRNQGGYQPAAMGTAPGLQSMMVPTTPSGSTIMSPPGAIADEQSYIENILRMNLGKMATIYMTFEGNREWNAKIFKGRLEAAGRDHIVISDPKTGVRYVLLMVNLDYVTFDEPLVYDLPFGTSAGAQTAVTAGQ